MRQDNATTTELCVRSLLETVRGAPGYGIHRAELERIFGRPWPQIWPTARGLYGRKLIDFCGPYMVAVPPQRPRAILCGPRPPTDEDRATVERFGAELERRAQLQLVPSVRKLADELERQGDNQ